ncbi:hypothetical protein Lal_00014339 [Lupinus albus]|nr:hypothetical protein Lal_00014339 [Lupinus albus]
MGSQYCVYLELALEAIFFGVFESDSYSARAGLFYPGDGVVDSLLAPRGSTTKRLKESDLVVTQSRAGLFYPEDDVVDSLLAPRGSTTKRLKESDLIVTQPVKIISCHCCELPIQQSFIHYK